MVFLILTRQGFAELAEKLGEPPSPAWLSPGVLSEQEISTYRDSGASLTVLNETLQTNVDSSLKEMLVIIGEHHPGQRIWVEYASGF